MAATINFTTQDHNGALSIRVEGTFDGAAALQLQHLINELQASSVELDFSQTRSFQDVAVALLTRTLQERAVTLRGLGQHQERMFRYFGVNTSSATDSRAYYKPEELLAH